MKNDKKEAFAKEPVKQDPNAVTRQIDKDLTKIELFTDNLIDMPMNKFLEQMSTYSIGSLNAMNVFFDDKQRRIGTVCDEFAMEKDSNTVYGHDHLLTVVTSFVVLQKIIDRKSAVEYFIKQRSLN